MFRHISKHHAAEVKDEDEGTFDTGKRVYHLQRSGVRKIDPWRVNFHIKRLNWDLSKQQELELTKVIKDVLLEGLVIVGKETDVPATCYMDVKKAMAKLQ